MGDDAKLEINDLYYSQVTLINSIKVLTIKLHELVESKGLDILEDYFKLLDVIITHCQDEQLSMMMYELCECLLKSPQENSLNVQIDLSLSKKGWLACSILKKATLETEHNKAKVEAIITQMLTNYRINQAEEMMACYEYAMLYFNTNSQKKLLRSFENTFGKGIFTKLRIIFERAESHYKFHKINYAPNLMRRLSDTIILSFEDKLIMCPPEKGMMLKDLSGSNEADESSKSSMEIDEPIDHILRAHKENFVDNPQFRNEKKLFKAFMNITNSHDSRYYYHNVKVLFPQIWKTFTKEQKIYLSQ